MKAVKSGILKYGANEVEVVQFGSGPKMMLCFHGFNQDATAFLPMQEIDNGAYTYISISLPGHGKTHWKEDSWSKEAFITIIERFKLELKVEKFDVIGYSVGGRFALTLVEQRPEWIHQVILIAADGIQKSWVYNTATRNPLGKSYFNKVMKNPASFYQWVDRFAAWKLVPAAYTKLSRKLLDNELFRAKMQVLWHATKEIVPEPAKVKYQIKTNKLSIHIIAPDKDELFTIKNAYKFAKALDTVQIHSVNSGHLVSFEQCKPILTSILNQQ